MIFLFDSRTYNRPPPTSAIATVVDADPAHGHTKTQEQCTSSTTTTDKWCPYMTRDKARTPPDGAPDPLNCGNQY